LTRRPAPAPPSAGRLQRLQRGFPCAGDLAQHVGEHLDIAATAAEHVAGRADEVQRHLDLVAGRGQGLAHALHPLLLGQARAQVLQMCALDLAAACGDIAGQQQQAQVAGVAAHEIAADAVVGLVHGGAGAGKPMRSGAAGDLDADLDVAEALAGLGTFQRVESGLLAQGLAQQAQRFASAQVAEQLLVLHVVEDDAPLLVQQHDHHGGGIEHGLDACLLLA
jgi:hypothetical protein